MDIEYIPKKRKINIKKHYDPNCIDCCSTILCRLLKFLEFDFKLIFQ